MARRPEPISASAGRGGGMDGIPDSPTNLPRGYSPVKNLNMGGGPQVDLPPESTMQRRQRIGEGLNLESAGGGRAGGGPVKLRAYMHQWKMFFLHVVIFGDLVVNVMYDSAVESLNIIAVAMIAQILGTILLCGIIYALFSATFVFQAGLLSILHKDFRGMLYFLPINLALLLWVRIRTIMILYRGESPADVWHDGGFYIAYCAHKVASVIFYYFTIMMSFRLGQIKYYKPEAWRKKEAQ